MAKKGSKTPGVFNVLFRMKLAKVEKSKQESRQKELLDIINTLKNQELTKNKRNDLLNTLSQTITIEEYLQQV